VAAILPGFLPKIRLYTIRHKKPAALHKETETLIDRQQNGKNILCV